MKKFVFILLLFSVSFGTVLVVAPEKLPQFVQKNLYKPVMTILSKLKTDGGTVASERTHDATAKNQLYKHTDKDGTLVFSDQKSKDAKIHEHSNNSVFIDMKSGYAKNDDTSNKGKSGVAAVLDPVNSINNEAAYNVAKMREAKRQKLAEQGL